MLEPIKVISVDISKPLKDIGNLEGYNKVRVLCKWNEYPVCSLTLSVVNNVCPAELIIKEIESKGCNELVRRLLILSLEHRVKIDEKFFNELILKENLNEIKNKPLVTVAVCSRDRSVQLKSCLDSLLKLNYSNLDLIIIDNAPSNNLTKDLVVNEFPQFRYVCEQRPGLDWARNRAIIEAKGVIICFTDDDVIVDKNWVSAIVKTFLEEPDTMAVAGLVEPYELEEESHVLFEMYGGFGRGYKPRWINIQNNYAKRWMLFGTGQYGTGANMAFRTFIFQNIGYFDNALDVGTVTNGGGDLDMFFRVLKFGLTLKYDPDAIVFHKHRNEYSKLKKQLTDHGIGLYSYIVKNIKTYPDERFQLLKLAIYWLFIWNFRRLVASYYKPLRFPRELIRTELIGSFIGFFRYQKAKTNLKNIESSFGKINYPNKSSFKPEAEVPLEKKICAVRELDLNNELKPVTGIEQYQFIRFFVKRDKKLLGTFDYNNNFKCINLNLVKELLIDNIGMKIIEESSAKYHEAYAKITTDYKNSVSSKNISHNFSEEISVSIVIGTYDRPEDLTACLKSLTKSNYKRKLEIIVVDNNPVSGITSNTLKSFPMVKLISEFRKGISFARNAGIRAASGEIIVTIDDDVTVSDTWLENLLAPFKRKDIAAVTGNILPLELETNSQYLFESYGGLGEGFEPKEFDSELFEKYRFRAFPAWEIGATSNSAFRANVLKNPMVGLFDEVLGPGTPTGVGEDTYLYYRIILNGHKILYEPNAFVWHKHRKTFKSLRKQIFNYSKGHVSYHLRTLFSHGDFRALTRIFVELPLAHLYRIINRLKGKSNYTILFILLEILGNILGPFVFFISIYRVRKIRSEKSKSGLFKQKIITAKKDAAILLKK